MLVEEAVKLSYDLIVLPGGLGGAQSFANSEQLVNLLKKQREANRPHGAICASPALVLEPHGLLNVVDDNPITSRGLGTSMEFSLAIVEKLSGRKKALEIAKTILFVRP